MARQPRPIETTDDELAKLVTETITYVPGPMDPSVVKWGGMTFQANVPKEVTGHAEGTTAQQLAHQVIERARENKHFRVGEGASSRPRREAVTLPKTSEEYRAYVVGWLKDPAIEHASDLIARFARDRELQAACEVGHDDFAYIATLFMPRLHELAKADELSEAQVSSLWINHGFNVLPW